MSYIKDLADGGYVWPGEIDARIKELEQGPVDEAEREDELAELTAFRDEVTGKVMAWSQVLIVDEDAFTEHVREEAEDGEEVSEALAPYMDWERYATAQKVDWQAVVVDGETYYVR